MKMYTTACMISVSCGYDFVDDICVSVSDFDFSFVDISHFMVFRFL